MGQGSFSPSFSFFAIQNFEVKKILLHLFLVNISSEKNLTESRCKLQGFILFCLVGLRLYVQVNNFSVISGRSHRFLGITSTFWEVNVSCSRIKHGAQGFTFRRKNDKFCIDELRLDEALLCMVKIHNII